MSVHFLEMDGVRLSKYETRESGKAVWRSFEVPILEDVYDVRISRRTPATHTCPAIPSEAPELDEVAELIGVLAFMLLKKGGSAL